MKMYCRSKCPKVERECKNEFLVLGDVPLFVDVPWLLAIASYIRSHPQQIGDLFYRFSLQGVLLLW